MVCSKLGYLQWWATKSCWFWMGIFKIARTQFLRNVQDILPLGFVYFQLYADMTCIHNTYTLTFENKWFHSATLLGFGLFRTTCSNKKRVHLLWGHESGPPGFIMFHPPKTSFLPDPGMWSRWFWSRGADLSLKFCCIFESCAQMRLPDTMLGRETYVAGTACSMIDDFHVVRTIQEYQSVTCCEKNPVQDPSNQRQ